MEKEITKAQIAKIWACAHDIGLDNELLYLLVPRGSIRAMTQAEASELIEHLIELGARRVGPRMESERTGASSMAIERAGTHSAGSAGSRQAGPEQAARPTTAATPDQRQFIHFLLGRLGWLQQPERTRGFLLKYAGTPTVEGIGEKARASAIIEALKAMWKRQRKADPR